MPFTARKLETEEELYAAAIRALARRAHSVFEMRQMLERRAADAEHVQSVLARLKHLNLLDDARYAREFARGRATGRRQGRYRIERELRRRGVPDRHIETALEDAFAVIDEAELVRARLARKLKSRGGPLDARRMASLYASLLRAGFSSDLIRRELRAIARASAEELPELPVEE